MKNPKSSVNIAVLACLSIASLLALTQQPVGKYFSKKSPFKVEELLVLYNREDEMVTGVPAPWEPLIGTLSNPYIKIVEQV